MSSHQEPSSHWTPLLSEGEFDLRAFAALILRRRYWALGGLLLSLLVGVGIAVTAPRAYRARAAILIEQNAPKVLSDVREVYDLGTQGYWSSNRNYYGTQREVLLSRRVAGRAAANLAITKEALTAELAQVPETPGTISNILEGIPESLAKRLRWLGFDKLDDRAALRTAASNFDAAGYVKGRLSVDPVLDSNLIAVAARHGDPEFAAEMANAVVASYQTVNLERKVDVTRSAVDWLATQTDDLKSRLEDSELALHEFKKENNLISVSIEDRRTLTRQRLEDLNSSLSDAQAERLRLQGIHAQVEAALKDEIPRDSLQMVLNNPLVQEIKGRLSRLREEEAQLLVRYTGKHQQVRHVREKLKRLDDELASEIYKILLANQRAYIAARDLEQRLRTALEEVRSQVLELNRKEIQYRRRRREVDNNRSLYQLVMKRHKEADLTRMLEVNNVTIHEAASVPTRPYTPRINRIMLLAFMIGVMVAVVLAFLVDYLDNTLKRREQVEQVLGLPFLGLIPQIRNEKKVSPELSDRDRYVSLHPRSTFAECCRTIRTNLMFMSTERSSKTILITSTGPREGKSTVVTNLAATMVQSGRSTVVIDTDMRKPRLHRSFGVSNDRGISSVMVGEMPLEEALQATDVPGLDVLTCGPIPPNPSELLHTQSFQDVLSALCARYDQVILDSPPVAAVTDAAVLASMCDGVIFVAESSRTTLPAALQAIRKLRDVNARILGCVLNSVDLEKASANGLYHAYYAYYYGKPEEGEAGISA